jgi:hypothetical protein
MGFGKRKRRKEKRGEKRDEESGGSTGEYGKFKPTTPEELKMIVKRAKKRERLKKEAKAVKPKREPVEPRAKIEGVKSKKFLRIYAKIMEEKAKLAAQMQAEGKKRKDKLEPWTPMFPRYNLSMDEHLADANFVYSVQDTLAHMSWKELKRLLKAALGEYDASLKVTYTASFKAVEQIMHQTLRTKADGGGVQFRLADRDRTLAIWPAKPIEERQMSKKEAKAAKEGKKSKKARKEAEEVEEQPSKKSKTDKGDKKLKAKKSKSDDDDGDEKPAKKKVKVGKLADDSVVSKLKERPKTGPKTKLLNLLSRKGMTFKKVRIAAKEAGLPVDKVGAWLTVMAKNGFVGIE